MSIEEIKIQVTKLIEETFRESWMDDGDWETYLYEIHRLTGITLDSLSENIQTGIENGYPIEVQFELIKKQFTQSNG